MFTSISSRAASAYKRVGVQTSVEGANPHQLVNMLFDALLSAMAAARSAIERGDIEGKGRDIGKAVRIIEEGLLSSLNKEAGGDVAANLAGVYVYCTRCLTQANLKNDAGKVEEAVALIEPIADAWKQMRLDGLNVQSGAGA